MGKVKGFMTQKYYNIRIRIANADNIQLEIYDTNHDLLGEPDGNFTFKGKTGRASSSCRALHGKAGYPRPKWKNWGNYYLMFYLTRDCAVNF